jgi:hypothetical protein
MHYDFFVFMYLHGANVGDTLNKIFILLFILALVALLYLVYDKDNQKIIIEKLGQKFNIVKDEL